MAAAGAIIPLPLPLQRPFPILKSSAGPQQSLDRSQPVIGDALHLELHSVSRKLSALSLISHGQVRNELNPKLARLSSGQLSESTSPDLVLDSQDAADSNCSAPHSQTPIIHGTQKNGDIDMYVTTLGGLGLLLFSALQFPEASVAATESSFPTVMTFAGAEPSNALSLPTWVIHVASVVEWVTAMTLVWKYGDIAGKSAWKGLTWGMVPLLGGAMCACTWHFFYNAEALEVLVVLQAFLTVVGNFTMWAAAYRIWKLCQEKVTID